MILRTTQPKFFTDFERDYQGDGANLQSVSREFCTCVLCRDERDIEQRSAAAGFGAARPVFVPSRSADLDEVICPACKGSGEGTAMSYGHGPDDYEYPCQCSRCDGSGVIAGAV